MRFMAQAEANGDAGEAVATASDVLPRRCFKMFQGWESKEEHRMTSGTRCWSELFKSL